MYVEQFQLFGLTVLDYAFVSNEPNRVSINSGQLSVCTKYVLGTWISSSMCQSLRTKPKSKCTDLIPNTLQYETLGLPSKARACLCKKSESKKIAVNVYTIWLKFFKLHHEKKKKKK